MSDRICTNLEVSVCAYVNTERLDHGAQDGMSSSTAIFGPSLNLAEILASMNWDAGVHSGKIKRRGPMLS